MTDWRRSGTARTACAVWLMLTLLQGCGPGSGGTGLPPEAGLGAEQPNSPVAALPPAPGLGTEQPNPPVAALPPAPGPGDAPIGGPVAGPPDRPADLAGPIERVDATVIRIAGTDLPRDEVDLLFEDGSHATTEDPPVGAEARAWRVAGRWQVLVRR